MHYYRYIWYTVHCAKICEMYVTEDIRKFLCGFIYSDCKG